MRSKTFYLVPECLFYILGIEVMFKVWCLEELPDSPIDILKKLYWEKPELWDPSVPRASGCSYKLQYIAHSVMAMELQMMFILGYALRCRPEAFTLMVTVLSRPAGTA